MADFFNHLKIHLYMETNFCKLTSICFLFVASSCAIVRPGEVGIKQKLGKIKSDHLAQGAHGFNPFIATIKKIPVRTAEAFNSLDVPTKEGLTVKAEISLLYHVKPEAAREVYTRYGMNYQEAIAESTSAPWRVISAGPTMQQRSSLS